MRLPGSVAADLLGDTDPLTAATQTVTVEPDDPQETFYIRGPAHGIQVHSIFGQEVLHIRLAHGNRSANIAPKLTPIVDREQCHPMQDLQDRSGMRAGAAQRTQATRTPSTNIDCSRSFNISVNRAEWITKCCPTVASSMLRPLRKGKGVGNQRIPGNIPAKASRGHATTTAQDNKKIQSTCQDLSIRNSFIMSNKIDCTDKNIV